jgi:hypothetical protein
VIYCLDKYIVAPLFNNIVVNKKLLDFLLRESCVNFRKNTYNPFQKSENTHKILNSILAEQLENIKTRAKYLLHLICIYNLIVGFCRVSSNMGKTYQIVNSFTNYSAKRIHN